jgi:hypothetical protein
MMHLCEKLFYLRDVIQVIDYYEAKAKVDWEWDSYMIFVWVRSPILDREVNFEQYITKTHKLNVDEL